MKKKSKKCKHLIPIEQYIDFSMLYDDLDWNYPKKCDYSASKSASGLILKEPKHGISPLNSFE